MNYFEILEENKYINKRGKNLDIRLIKVCMTAAVTYYLWIIAKKMYLSEKIHLLNFILIIIMAEIKPRVCRHLHFYNFDVTLNKYCSLIIVF